MLCKEPTGFYETRSRVEVKGLIWTFFVRLGSFMRISLDLCGMQGREFNSELLPGKSRTSLDSLGVGKMVIHRDDIGIIFPLSLLTASK